MNKMFINSGLEIKGFDTDESNNSVLKIAGYANYATKDRSNEVILPEAWNKGLDNYRKNPIVLFAHDHNKPIGTCTALRADQNGLFIEAIISSAAEKLYGIQTLIRDGALKTFSVGFIPKKGRKDTATDTLFITELELLENSIVSVPMQQDSIFSIVKSLQDAGDYENFLKNNVEVFDSAKEAQETPAVEVKLETDISSGIDLPTEIVPFYVEAQPDVTAGIDLNPSVKREEENIIWAALTGKTKVKIGSKNYILLKADVASNSIDLQEVSILGNSIDKILNVDINTLNILNLDKVDTSDHAVFKVVEKFTNEEISRKFSDLVKADVGELKTLSAQENLPNLARKQLSYTIDLKEKPIKDWNPDDYIVANKIVDYILFRSHHEADKNLLVLHGHVEEKKMTEQIVAAAEEVTQVAVPSEAPSAAPAPAPVVVSEPKVLDLVKRTGEALEKLEAARDNASASRIKDLEDKFEQFMSQYNAHKDKIAAANNEKVAYVTQLADAAQLNRKDLTNAVLLAYGKNPEVALTMGSFASTKLGAQLLAQHKATITSVDVLTTHFSAELVEQMQMELKVAKLLRSMTVDSQTFKIPVADEDIAGDIAMFANGTYNTGVSDSTRVPTTRQNTISAVSLTPHKFMGTTHLAKDEQEDVVIPLLDFQVRALMRRMARSVDKSLLRGDGSLTGFTASPSATVTNGSGMVSVIKGIVPLAYDISGLRVSSGGTSTKATPASIASARAVLGRFGLDVAAGNLVYMTSLEGYNELVTNSDFRTVDKFGANATYLTGQVGAIYGIPVVVTEFLDNVGSSGNQIGILIYVPGFLVGMRRAFDVESEYDARRQLTAIYLSTRFDMKALTTNANAVLDATKYSFASVVHSA